MNRKTKFTALTLAALCFGGTAAIAQSAYAENSAVFVTTAAQPLELGPWQTCDVSFSNGDDRAPSIIFKDVPAATIKKQRELGMNAKLTAGSPVMLFTWKHEDYRPVWMKGVAFPLSVAYINKAGRVTQIDALTPLSEKTHWSNEKIVAMVEVVPPTLSVSGVKVGSQLVLDNCPNLTKGTFEFER